MIKDNVGLLDMDEKDREMRISLLPKDILEFCKKYNLVIRLDWSDVALYVSNQPPYDNNLGVEI